MKLSLVGLALLIVLAVALPADAVQTTITSPAGTIRPGWNLLGLGGIPCPNSVTKVPDPPYVLNINKTLLNDKLQRWDAPTQGMRRYNEWDPGKYGNMLLTDGFWLKWTETRNISFTGLNDNDTADIWVGLPKTGWTLIGTPFSYNFPWKDAKVTDGTQTVSIYTAKVGGGGLGWLHSVGYWWDNATQGLKMLGLPEDYKPSSTLEAWRGYWIRSNRDNLALILESIP